VPKKGSKIHVWILDTWIELARKKTFYSITLTCL
jgi:hypothetical protein